MKYDPLAREKEIDGKTVANLMPRKERNKNFMQKRVVGRRREITQSLGLACWPFGPNFAILSTCKKASQTAKIWVKNGLPSWASNGSKKYMGLEPNKAIK